MVDKASWRTALARAATRRGRRLARSVPLPGAIRGALAARGAQGTGRPASPPAYERRPPPCPEGLEIAPPDFVGIGTQKAGTSWWHSLIASHPDVYDDASSDPAAPRRRYPKERHYLDFIGADRDPSPELAAEYAAWFPRPAGKLAGEWTPSYVRFHWTAMLLQGLAPRAKLLVLVRDPVERYRSGLREMSDVFEVPRAFTTEDAF
ncbi:MAG TPA: sulfotransferase domain-containing protein, partial [Acidimicrobiales bacterium]|nr:sulfotransferase domain-containing protein [Acidimicrobiales bacterium]